MSGKQRTHFPRDGHRTEVIGQTQLWNDENNKDKVALLRHFSESHGNVNKPPTHEAYTFTFVKEPNSRSSDFCEDKWYHKLNAQINIQNMILPRVR